MARPKKQISDCYYKAFPTRLRHLITVTQTTHKELAEYLEKTRQAVSCYCDGSSSPDWETLAKISQFFNTSCDYLIGNSEVYKSDLTVKTIADELHIEESTADYLASADNLESSQLVNEIICVLKDTPLGDAILYHFGEVQGISECNRPSNIEIVDQLKEACDRFHWVILSQEDTALYHIKALADRLARGIALLYGFDDREI